jgi:hypothetical protein
VEQLEDPKWFTALMAGPGKELGSLHIRFPPRWRQSAAHNHGHVSWAPVPRVWKLDVSECSDAAGDSPVVSVKVCSPPLISPVLNKRAQIAHAHAQMHARASARTHTHTHTHTRTHTHTHTRSLTLTHHTHTRHPATQVVRPESKGIDARHAQQSLSIRVPTSPDKISEFIRALPKISQHTTMYYGPQTTITPDQQEQLERVMPRWALPLSEIDGLRNAFSRPAEGTTTPSGFGGSFGVTGLHDEYNHTVSIFVYPWFTKE